jgi:tetratricopeptide (TPR) repeat protein
MKGLGFVKQWKNKLVSRGNVSFYLWQGKRLARDGKIHDAISAYNKAFDLKPNLSFEIYKPLRDKTKLQPLENEATAKVEAAVNMGKRLVKVGDMDTAITTYRTAIDSNPRNSSTYTLLGDALYKNGRFTQAEECYRTAIALSENVKQHPEALERLVRSKSVKNTVLITQVAINYFPMFKVWYSYFRKFEISNFLVIALDPIVHNKLQELGVATYLLPIFCYQRKIKSIFWFETVKLRRRINSMGVNYIHTDIDAFWLRNPLSLMESIKCDILGSIAHGQPRHLVRDWGFAICCGFYSIRSNERTRKIYDQYVRLTGRLPHDQAALNQLLYDNGITWETQSTSYKRGRCNGSGLDVYILPENIVSRDPSSLSRTTIPYVFHPYLGSGAMNKKLETLNEWGISMQGDAI